MASKLFFTPLLLVNNLHNLKEILQNHRKTLVKILIVELKTSPALHNYLRPGETLVFIDFLEKSKRAGKYNLASIF